MGKKIGSIIGAGIWVLLAHTSGWSWLYLLALATLAVGFAQRIPPLPKIGDYEDD